MPDASCPKFLADENVGKLGRWLRILGYDVAYQSPALDAQLALKALRENRIILTRDREFVERRMVERHLLLTSQDPVEQLKQVIETFDLKLDRNSFFTRCLDCNTPIESVPKADVQAVVPDYVYRTQNQFHRCPICEKFYWAGSHTTNFQDWLKRVGQA